MCERYVLPWPFYAYAIFRIPTNINWAECTHPPSYPFSISSFEALFLLLKTLTIHLQDKKQELWEATKNIFNMNSRGNTQREVIVIENFRAPYVWCARTFAAWSWWSVIVGSKAGCSEPSSTYSSRIRNELWTLLFKRREEVKTKNNPLWLWYTYRTSTIV